MSNKFCTFFVDNFGEKTNLNIYNVTKIVSYETSTLFLTNGSVFGIGKNDKRQLGLPGSNVHEITLLALEDVVDVSMNEGRTLFITKKNQLFGAGSHWYSALGHLSDTAGDTPMLIPSDRYNNEKLLFGAPAFSFSVIVTDKSLFVLGQVWLDPQNSKTSLSTHFSLDHIIANNRKIIAAQCGSFHVGLLTNDGCVFTGGDAASEKLGRGKQSKKYGLEIIPGNNFFTSMYLVADYTVLGTSTGSVLLCGRFYSETFSTLTEITKLTSPVWDLCGSFSNNTHIIAVSESFEVVKISSDLFTKKIPVLAPNNSRLRIATSNNGEMYFCFSEKEDSIAAQFSRLTKALSNCLLTDVSINV